MDHRLAHLEADRVKLLMDAAKHVKAYVDQNPEPHTEVTTEADKEQPVYQHEPSR